MSQDAPKDWRELCRRAAQELDPDKLMDLIVEINKALDEQARKRKENIDNLRDVDTEEAVSMLFQISSRHRSARNTKIMRILPLRFANFSSLPEIP